MLPRRNIQQRNVRDVMIDNLQREIYQLHQRLTRLEQRKVERKQGMQQKRRSHHLISLNDKEDNSPTVPDPGPLWSSEPIWDSEPKWDAEPNWDDNLIIQLPHQSQNDLEQDSHKSLMEEDGIYEKDLKPKDIVPDATGTLTSPSNQLLDEKVQADLDQFVDDGSLDDNVESSLSHDDANLRNEIGRCKDVTEGGHDKKAVLWFMDKLKSKPTLGEHCILSYLTDGVPRKFRSSTSGRILFVTTLFEVEELVWISLSKESFPHGSISKLKQRTDGPFRIIRKLSENANQIDFPGESNVLATFNIADLSSHYEDEAPPTPGE